MPTYKEGLKQAVDLVMDYHGGGVAKFVLVLDKNDVHDVYSTACSAGLRDCHKKNTKRIVSRICLANNRRPLPNDVIERYLHWLINTSPFSTAFIKCTGKAAFKRGYTILRCDRDANLVASAVTAARMCTEHVGTPAFTWDKLVAQGVHPDMAFLMAHYVSCTDHNYVSYGAPTGNHWGWHSCIDGSIIDDEYVTNFMNHTPADQRLYGKKYKDCGTYSLMCGLWSTNNGELIANKVKIAIESIIMACNKPKEVDKNINPFAAKAINQRAYHREASCRVDDFIPLYANWIKENIHV